MCETGDHKILNALQGMIRAQDGIAQKDETSPVSFARHFNRLPEDVAKRLTHLQGDLFSSCDKNLNWRPPPAKTITAPEVREQLVRAANSYRQKLGLTPLSSDGWPK